VLLGSGLARLNSRRLGLEAGKVFRPGLPAKAVFPKGFTSPAAPSTALAASSKRRWARETRAIHLLLIRGLCWRLVGGKLAAGLLVAEALWELEAPVLVALNAAPGRCVLGASRSSFLAAGRSSCSTMLAAARCDT